MNLKNGIFVFVLAFVIFAGGFVVGQRSVSEIDLTEYYSVSSYRPGLSGFGLNFRNGLARVVDKQGEMYHIGTNGKPAYDARYYWVGSFLDPDSAIASDNGLNFNNRFHIGRDGNPLYEERYDEASSFLEGLALVEKYGKYFHITKDGKPAYEARYEWINRELMVFYAGTVRAYKDDQCLNIDRNTGEVIEELELNKCPYYVTEGR